MASTDDLRLFIEERLRAADPNVDLNTGSQYQVQVVDPIVRRFTPDVMETNLKSFMLTRLQQEFPDLFAKEGSALSDLLVKPNLIFLEPLRREIRSVKRQLSLSDPATLTAPEADALMANLFITRKTGNYARVRVRMYFQNAVSVSIGSTNYAYTASNLRYIPDGVQTITAEGMLANRDGSLYYFDANFVAEAAGTKYNIGASEIINVTGLTAATRATNLAKAQYGRNEETTLAMIARGEQSIGERTLATVPGAVGVLFEEFADLTVLQIVGFNDSEMQRDVIKGGNLGDIEYYGTDGATTDDGDADGYTPYFDVVSSIDFTATFGPVGTDITAYSLMVVLPTGPQDYALSQVEGATRVSIAETGADRLPDGSLSGLSWTIRQRAVLTLSDIPGGILFPDSTGGELVIPNDEIHVGGVVDYYVRGGTIEDKTLALQLIADQNAIARREDARTVALSDEVTLQDLTSDEYDNIEVGKTSLYLEEGADLGSYRVIDKAPGPPMSVRLDTALTATANSISFVLVDDIDIDLVEPKEIRYEGTDLRTISGSLILSTVSGSPDFNDVGVLDTDVVEILNGDDAGVYEIASGGVSANQITLLQAMIQTASPLNYRIYRQGDGIETPMLRPQTVELLDSSLNPTGSYVPYRRPVDAQSRSFQNPGRGAKAGTDDAATGDTLARLASPDEDVVVSSDAGRNWWNVGLRVGDIVNINTSDNQGFYTVTEVGGATGATINPDELRLDRDLPWNVSGMEYTAGEPSIGSFRLYFLEPVTIEVSYADTRLEVELASGSIQFRPDPDVDYQYLPTASTVPTLKITNLSDLVEVYTPGAVAIDMIKQMTEVGDEVEITYAPLVGSIDLAAGAPFNLDNQTIIIDVGSGPETVTFSGTSLQPADIVSQINAQLSDSVASEFVPSAAPATSYLMLRADQAIEIKNNPTPPVADATGTIFGNRTPWQPWLPGAFAGQDTNNDAPDQGTYSIGAVSTTNPEQLNLLQSDGSAFSPIYTITDELGHYARLSHTGLQRITATEMAQQVDDLGLYYFDIECISLGYGDVWNIDADTQAEITGYESEGWDITVEDENLSYSTEERPWLDISPRVLLEGATDDVDNYTELLGQSIQFAYERVPIVEDVNTFLQERRNRVVCKNPLARALLPTFIRTYIQYRGGDSETDIRAVLASHIEAVLPENALEASDLIGEIRLTGSTYEMLPIDLVGVSHREDRTIWITRNQDSLSIGRLAAMIPDDDGTTAAGASYILLNRLTD